MTGEQRAQFNHLLREHRTAGRLTVAAWQVGETLCEMLGDGAQLIASHDDIAARSACHIATVKRALVRLKELKLVTWKHWQASDPRGWRHEQKPNIYTLHAAADAADREQVQCVIAQ